MRLRHTLLLPRRVIATTLSFLAVVVASRAGEPIRFSRPAVALASPVKEQAQLPEPRSKGLDFAAPEVERPMPVVPPQQPIVRVERRDDPEAGLHPLLRTPKIFADPDEQKLSSDPARSLRLPGSVLSQPPPWSSDKFGKSRADSALSPVTDPNWDARDSNRRSKDSKDSTKGDRNDNRPRSPFGAQDDSDSKFDSGRSSSVRDLFTAHVKEKPRAMELERQEAFQQLLNPSAESGAKTPSSLQPVVSAADVKPGSLGIPTIGGGGNSGLTPRSSDPMAAFNRQHDRLRGPVMDDINKKYSAQPSLPVKPSSLDPRLPLPLNRQPAIHEFPQRKF
jgi:hypothetical protein